MITVTFGTAVFATEGTGSSNDMQFSFNAESWVSNGATLDTQFTSTELPTYSDGAVTASNAMGRFSVNTDGSFTFSKAAGAGQNTFIYIPFKEAIDYDTIDGKVVVKMKVNKNMTALVDGATKSGYTEQKFGFYSEDNAGVKTATSTVLFNTTSNMFRIGKTAAQQNTSLNDTELVTLLGSSIPIVLFPGIGA